MNSGNYLTKDGSRLVLVLVLRERHRHRQTDRAQKGGLHSVTRARAAGTEHASVSAKLEKLLQGTPPSLAWLLGVFERRCSSVIGGTHTSDGRAASGRAVACLACIYGEKRPTARCAPLRGHDRCPFISDPLSSLFILRSV
jgi:hypothetical protein